MAKKNTVRKNRKELKNKAIKKNVKENNNNSKVTKAEREKAKRAIEHAQAAFKIPGQIPPKEIALATEYLSHDGQLVRKTKAGTKNAKAKARAVLGKKVRLIDAVRAILPAVNNLQAEFISQEKGLRIITNMLKYHGYTTKDLYAAAKRVSKSTTNHYRDVIKNYVKAYTKKHGKKNK